MKAAFVFLSMPVGGAEDFAIAMAGHFPAGVEARLVCLRSRGILGEEAGADLVPCAVGKRFSPCGVARLATWFRQEGINVVHSQTYHAHTYAIPAAHRAGIPCVLHQQKTLEPLPFHRCWTMRRLCRKADRILSLSAKTRDDIAATFGVPPAKIEVLPNAVSGELFRSGGIVAPVIPLSVPVIGAVASLNGVKNHEATISMMAMLRERIPSARCFIVGEGAGRSSLEKQISEAGLTGVVTLAGNQRPVAPWLAGFDVLVHPSHWEGQPMAILQAMAGGVPVVASRIEGNVAALGTFHPALFNPGDQPAYADLVARVLSDPVFRESVLVSQAGHPPPLASEVALRLARLYDLLVCPK